MDSRAAIYHFTNKSEHRPKVYMDQIKLLEDYAKELGFDGMDLFIDKSLKVSERDEFNRFLSCSEQYKALIVKDFYHLNDNTGACMKIISDLTVRGIEIYTMVNGNLVWGKPSFDKKLRVATYTCQSGTFDEMKQIVSIKNDTYKLFIEKKTNWDLVDQYHDKYRHQTDDEQINIKELIKNREKYDLLLVNNMNDIHWRTSKFCKIREQLQLDIYSLQEGFLKY